jgi:hypothetical protein
MMQQQLCRNVLPSSAAAGGIPKTPRGRVGTRPQAQVHTRGLAARAWHKTARGLPQALFGHKLNTKEGCETPAKQKHQVRARVSAAQAAASRPGQARAGRRTRQENAWSVPSRPAARPAAAGSQRGGRQPALQGPAPQGHTSAARRHLPSGWVVHALGSRRPVRLGVPTPRRALHCIKGWAVVCVARKGRGRTCASRATRMHGCDAAHAHVRPRAPRKRYKVLLIGSELVYLITHPRAGGRLHAQRARGWLGLPGHSRQAGWRGRRRHATPPGPAAPKPLARAGLMPGAGGGGQQVVQAQDQGALGAS